jgi:adenylate cyclase
MEAPPLQRKLVAILAADVAGYSRLMEANEERALATLSAHRGIIDEIIARHRGRVAGTAGDSVLAEFASVLDCAHAAVEIQNSLAETNEAVPRDRRMEFRIGLNVGDVMVKDGDIFGDGVNIAARLEALAEPGGICVSRGVRDHIRHKLAVAFEDLGEQRVKNIARPIRAFQLRLNDGTEMSEVAEDSAPEPPQADEVEIEFWDSIKQSANPLEYRVYLEQYPEGAFASLAHARLQSLENGGAIVTEAPVVAVSPKVIELAYWDTVKDSGNPEMFQAYLDKYPRGEFAELARAKIVERECRSSAASQG